MITIGDRSFKLKKNVTQKEFVKAGFRVHCDSDGNAVYSKRFIAHMYNDKPTLLGSMRVCPDCNLYFVDVYNLDLTEYRPYYFVEYGNYDPLLSEINKRVVNQIVYTQLFTEVKKDGVKNKRRRVD